MQYGLRSCTLGLVGFGDYTGFQSATGPTTSVNDQFEDFGNFQTGAQSIGQAPPLLQPTPNGTSTGIGVGMLPLLQPTPAQPVGKSGMGMGMPPLVQMGMGTSSMETPVSCHISFYRKQSYLSYNTRTLCDVRTSLRCYPFRHSLQ